ncbi:MAG: dihydrolipoamide acetyltransferase family protein [Pirellulaceae bacterium]
MDYRLPELGEGVYEADFVEWRVRPGQEVTRGESLAEVTTDKALMELPAPFAGRIDSMTVEAGQTIEVGQVILHYTPAQGEPEEELIPNATASSDSQPHGEAVRRRGASVRAVQSGDGEERASEIVPAAPAVRRVAQALGIDLRDISPSGPAGRVLIDDLTAYVRSSQDREHTSRPQSTRSNAMDLGTPGERIKLQGVRRSIAEHMVVSKKTIPHFSYIDECNVTEMVALRNALKRPLYTENVKLTSLPFYVKAVVAGLKRVPLINSSLDDHSGEIVVHDVYHVGIATATAKGLVVPVIRHADRLNLADTAREIERLIRSARAGKLSRDELRGSTFTISSVGNIGGLVSTPIIHHPEVGIVAVGKVFRRPVYDDQGDIVPAQIAYLSFSFDHRVVDGSVGAIFANVVIGLLEHPRSLVDE